MRSNTDQQEDEADRIPHSYLKEEKDIYNKRTAILLQTQNISTGVEVLRYKMEESCGDRQG